MPMNETTRLRTLDAAAIDHWKEDLARGQAAENQETALQEARSLEQQRATLKRKLAALLGVDAEIPAGQTAYRLEYEGRGFAFYLGGHWDLTGAPLCPECDDIDEHQYVTIRNPDSVVGLVTETKVQPCENCREATPTPTPPTPPKEVEAEHGMLRLGDVWVNPLCVERVIPNVDDYATCRVVDRYKSYSVKVSAIDVIWKIEQAIWQRPRCTAGE